jgi:hypothetical protein
MRSSGDCPTFRACLRRALVIAITVGLLPPIACAVDLYRAFASVARLPWFAKHQRLLKYCVQRAHLRDEISYRYWRVDWDLIEAQIKAKRHDSMRSQWLRDPQTSRFIEPPDPVRPMVVEFGNKLEPDPRAWHRRNPRRPGFWRERRRGTQ